MSSVEKNEGLISVFDGGLFQALGANSAEERDSWLQALQLASYECMRSQLLALQQRIEAFSGHKHDTDIQMLRLQRGISAGSIALYVSLSVLLSNRTSETKSDENDPLPYNLPWKIIHV